MTAPLIDGAGEWLTKKDKTFLEKYSSARERRRLFRDKPFGVPGSLWEREAARDVQAHGEPRSFTRYSGGDNRGPLVAEMPPRWARKWREHIKAEIIERSGVR